MILTNKEILQLLSSIYSIKQKQIEQPIIVSFLLTKIMKQLNPLYKTILETQQELLDKYGSFNEEKILYIPPENINIFNSELNNLYKISNTIQDLPKIKLNDLNGSLTLEEMEGLYPILEE